MSTRAHLGAEHRRSRRYAAQWDVPVRDAIRDCPAGRLANVSDGGLMLIHQQPPRPHGIFQLRMTLPGTSSRAMPVELGVQALWSKPTTRPDVFWAGYRIIAADSDSARRLQSWIGQQSQGLGS